MFRGFGVLASSPAYWHTNMKRSTGDHRLHSVPLPAHAPQRHGPGGRRRRGRLAGDVVAAVGRGGDRAVTDIARLVADLSNLPAGCPGRKGAGRRRACAALLAALEHAHPGAHLHAVSFVSCALLDHRTVPSLVRRPDPEMVVSVSGVAATDTPAPSGPTCGWTAARRWWCLIGGLWRRPPRWTRRPAPSASPCAMRVRRPWTGCASGRATQTPGICPVMRPVSMADRLPCIRRRPRLGR